MHSLTVHKAMERNLLNLKRCYSDYHIIDRKQTPLAMAKQKKMQKIRIESKPLY